jgi:hypothetical protein
MKYITKIHMILLAAILFFAGCTKKDQNMPSMNATINNAAFSAFGYRVTTSSGPGTPISPGTHITINGSNLPSAAGEIPTTITIAVRKDVADYAFDSPYGNSCVEVYFSSAATNGVPVIATSGEVRITNSTAHTVQGSFNFIIEDKTVSYAVTNGQFFGTF